MELTFLDHNRHDVSVIGAYSSFVWVERYDEYGELTLKLSPTDSTQFILKGEETYIKSSFSNRLMVCDKIEVDTTDNKETVLTITGKTAESLLTRRICWYQFVCTSTFQGGILQLLNDNFKPSIEPDRIMDDLEFVESTDPAITSIPEFYQVPVGYLYSTIQSLCKKRKVGFKIELNDNTRKLEFSLYKGVNRSESQTVNAVVEFSPSNENLIRSKYAFSKQKHKNVAFVAGEGEGSDRITTYVYSPMTPGLDYEWAGISRKELFVDASGISKTEAGGTLTDEQYLQKLQSKGLEELAKNEYEEEFEGEISLGNYVYQTDFNLGDIVQVKNEYGHSVRARIIEMVFSSDKNGWKVYPKFTTAL